MELVRQMTKSLLKEGTCQALLQREDATLILNSVLLETALRSREPATSTTQRNATQGNTLQLFI